MVKRLVGIARIRQRSAKLKQWIAMTSEKQRKADAFRKIKLGGLVIKAGLGEEDPAVLLGLLLEAADLCKKPDFRARVKSRGDLAFSADQYPERTAKARPAPA